MTAARRWIGLDVHRDFAQVAIWQGGTVRRAGTFATTPEGVRQFAAGLAQPMRWRWRRPGTRGRSPRWEPIGPARPGRHLDGAVSLQAAK